MTTKKYEDYLKDYEPGGEKELGTKKYHREIWQSIVFWFWFFVILIVASVIIGLLR